MESSVATPLEGRGVDARTIAEAFRRTVSACRDQVAVRTRSDEISWTWGELCERVDALAGGLAQLGLARGDTVAVLLVNRPEFHVVDLAAMTLGATPFSIYQTSSAEQIEYVVADADTRIIVTEPAFLETVLAARARLPRVEHVLVVEPGDASLPEGCTAIDDVAGGPSFDAEAHWRAVDPDDVLTLIYTSGTTGPPKGVQLAHRNVLASARGIEQLLDLPVDGRVISWLPAAHVAERVAHHYIPIVFGITITCCPDPRQIAGYLPEVRPSWFFAVPRIWEKLKAGLEVTVAQFSDDEREEAIRAFEASVRKVRLEQAGEPVPGDLALAVARADEQLFAPIRERLGFDQVRAVHVGAAPTPLEVLEFFHAIGIPVAEMWGMSELAGAATCNPPGRIKLGTVGPPLPGAEIKIAEDGELLARGDLVMLGYRNLPDQTAETIDTDGWLHTGDVATMDEDGYVTLIDRKKEIIINAAGKNMSPANIEATLKAASPMIGQAMCVGDRRPYNTALIVLDPDYAPMWASKNDVAGGDLAALAVDERVRAVVQEGVDAANQRLARVEQIKRFDIVRGDWLPGGDELTPTMKLKRKPIAEKYAEQIEALYAES